jgi:hypothetical protein
MTDQPTAHFDVLTAGAGLSEEHIEKRRKHPAKAAMGWLSGGSGSSFT